MGSKAAGFVLLLRVLFGALPLELVGRWKLLLMGMSAVTILYGNLCAIPQRNLKRLLGYSSIANAGYLLLGVAVMSAAGKVAILFPGQGSQTPDMRDAVAQVRPGPYCHL